MKRLTISFIFFFVVTFLFGQESKPTSDVVGPKIEFKETVFEFGDIQQGDAVEHIFQFRNVGDQPLILTEVKTTCGCTASEWSKEPIAPGDSSMMNVKFNSRGKMGMQNKVVTIISNATNNPERVKIVTNVLAPASTKEEGN